MFRNVSGESWTILLIYSYSFSPSVQNREFHCFVCSLLNQSDLCHVTRTRGFRFPDILFCILCNINSDTPYFFLPCDAMHSADCAVARFVSAGIFCRNGSTYHQTFSPSARQTILVFVAPNIMPTFRRGQGRRKLSGRYGGRHTNPERWWAAPYQ